MYSKEIDRLIDSWKDEYIEMLRRWISLPSVAGESAGEGKPFGEVNRKMLDMALSDASGMGFEVDNVDGYAGHVQMGEGDVTMGILAHLDVVPLGEGWTRDPLGGEIEDGRIYGRGTADDKGSAVAALFAMRAVRDAGIELKHGVRLILGCDEEVGMSDMRYYASVRKMPDYGFSPDAAYPLINIEKGGLTVLISGSGDGTTARIPVYSISAGERVNVVPGIARAEIGTQNVTVDEIRAALTGLEGVDVAVLPLGEDRAELVATGASAHAAKAEDGRNAAGMLLIALNVLGAGGGLAPMIAALADKLGLASDGAALNIAHSDQLSGRLTCNLGLLNCDGREMSAQLDIRYPIGCDEDKMMARINLALAGSGLSASRFTSRPVHHVPEDSEVVQGLLQVYGDITGLETYTIAIGGGTYARMMPNTVAFGSAFPGEADTCHMPDESADIDNLILSAKIMAHAIERLAGR